MSQDDPNSIQYWMSYQLCEDPEAIYTEQKEVLIEEREAERAAWEAENPPIIEEEETDGDVTVDEQAENNDDNAAPGGKAKKGGDGNLLYIIIAAAVVVVIVVIVIIVLLAKRNKKGTANPADKYKVEEVEVPEKPTPESMDKSEAPLKVEQNEKKPESPRKV